MCFPIELPFLSRILYSLLPCLVKLLWLDKKYSREQTQGKLFFMFVGCCQLCIAELCIVAENRLSPSITKLKN